MAIDIVDMTVSPYRTPSPKARPIPDKYISPFLSNLPFINLHNTYLANVIATAARIEYTTVYAVLLLVNASSIDGISASADIIRLQHINTNIEYANAPASTLTKRPFHLLMTTIVSTINADNKRIPPADSIFSAPAGIPFSKLIPYSSTIIPP